MFEKGRPRPPNAGRKKGSLNRNNAALRDMILAALEGAGGKEYLQLQANKNPNAFLSLIGKVLPLSITGGDGSDNALKIIIQKPEDAKRLPSQ